MSFRSKPSKGVSRGKWLDRQKKGRGSKRKAPVTFKPNKRPRRAAVDVSQLTGEQRDVFNACMAGKNVFFTGCAGTGKSFLLSKIIQAVNPSTTFVTASTGISAVALNGITLHCFSGIGLGKGEIKDLIARVRKSHRARERWRTCELLIIDEISMIDSELFDKIEALGRTFGGNKNKPFGGIQLLITGDFFQLPPVSKSGSKGFAFEAASWNTCIDSTFVLKHVFRQKNREFVDLLNEIRVGECSDQSEYLLQQCVDREFVRGTGVLPTILYPTRGETATENASRLRDLPGRAVRFVANSSGEKRFREQLERNCPAAQTLELKADAQVVLLTNLNVSAGLVNGSRGVVISFEEKTGYPRVRFRSGVYAVAPHEWTITQGGMTVASRKQVPLKLAWALSIHKSQGMTLTRVCLTMNRIFEHGQAYVALSRVRDLSGLRIEGWKRSVIKAHPKVIDYYAALDANEARAASTRAVPRSVASREQPFRGPAARRPELDYGRATKAGQGDAFGGLHNVSHDNDDDDDDDGAGALAALMEEANKDDTSDDWGETVEELTRPVAALASSARVAATDGRPIPRGRSLVPSDAATTSRPSIGPRRTSGRGPGMMGRRLSRSRSDEAAARQKAAAAEALARNPLAQGQRRVNVYNPYVAAQQQSHRDRNAATATVASDDSGPDLPLPAKVPAGRKVMARSATGFLRALEGKSKSSAARSVGLSSVTPPGSRRNHRGDNTPATAVPVGSALPSATRSPFAAALGADASRRTRAKGKKRTTRTAAITDFFSNS